MGPLGSVICWAENRKYRLYTIPQKSPISGLLSGAGPGAVAPPPEAASAGYQREVLVGGL